MIFYHSQDVRLGYKLKPLFQLPQFTTPNSPLSLIYMPSCISWYVRHQRICLNNRVFIFGVRLFNSSMKEANLFSNKHPSPSLIAMIFGYLKGRSLCWRHCCGHLKYKLNSQDRKRKASFATTFARNGNKNGP